MSFHCIEHNFVRFSSPFHQKKKKSRIAFESLQYYIYYELDYIEIRDEWKTTKILGGIKKPKFAWLQIFERSSLDTVTKLMGTRTTHSVTSHFWWRIILSEH